MGPLSHTFVASKVTGKTSSLLVFGSILPDIAWSSKIKRWRVKIHENTRIFYSFTKANYPHLLDLALGVRLHAVEDKGADYYSDDNDVGFAKIEAHKIHSEVALVLGLDAQGIPVPFGFGLKINSSSWIGTKAGMNKKIALVIAHNFIECGVELNLLEHNKKLTELYKHDIDNLHIDEIVRCLSHYLGEDNITIRNELKKYIRLMNPKNFSSMNSIVTETVLPLFENILNRRLDHDKTTNLLIKAKEITKQNYLVFLNNAIDHMKQDFKKIL